jgi:hypothetical protein
MYYVSLPSYYYTHSSFFLVCQVSNILRINLLVAEISFNKTSEVRRATNKTIKNVIAGAGLSNIRSSSWLCVCL